VSANPPAVTGRASSRWRRRRRWRRISKRIQPPGDLAGVVISRASVGAMRDALGAMIVKRPADGASDSHKIQGTTLFVLLQPVPMSWKF